MSTDEFSKRRQQFIQHLPANSLAILFTNQELLRNGDTTFDFRAHSDFYYLTGFNEPEAVAVFIPGRAKGDYILFNRECDPALEVWTGKRVGQMSACQHFGAKQAFPIAQLSAILPDLLEGKSHLYYAIGRESRWDMLVMQCVNELRQKVRGNKTVPQEFINIETILHEMRLRKSSAEISIMRKAAQISAGAHVRAMQACQPTLWEYQLEAELTHEFHKHGCHATAYSNIVASGANACILHYTANDAQMRAGDLVLVDAGCEFENYASDITRTFPISGHFNKEQQALYEVVLAAQLACINMVRPGMTWNMQQDTAIKILTQGLIDLEILKGELQELIETGAYKNFYMHRVGHWLGLDVHDVGAYKIQDAWRTLEPNMIFTIEPGLYIAAGNKAVAEKWWNIGIRIEDDALVTEDGCEILSKDVPKTVQEIETLMKAK